MEKLLKVQLCLIDNEDLYKFMGEIILGRYVLHNIENDKTLMTYTFECTKWQYKRIKHDLKLARKMYYFKN